MEALDQWMNVSALGCLIICMIWGITKGLPNLVETFREQSAEERKQYFEENKAARQEFREELQEQRQAFRESLSQQSEQSRQLAQSGHEAVRRLAEDIRGLSERIGDE